MSASTPLFGTMMLLPLQISSLLVHDQTQADKCDAGDKRNSPSK